MTGAKPIVRRKLADEVLDRLLKMIEDRDLGEDGRLPGERELMARFSVGRPAVREALQTLQQMGLIEIHHGEKARLVAVEPRLVLEQIGVTVKHLLLASPGHQDHLRQARLLFESGMVRLAATDATPADVRSLESAWEAQRDATGDTARFVQCDIDFHTCIARVSGNPILTALSEALFLWVVDFYPRLLRVPGTEALTLQEHRRILDAIAAHHPEAAVAAMTAHLTRSNPLYQSGERPQPKKVPAKTARVRQAKA